MDRRRDLEIHNQALPDLFQKNMTPDTRISGQFPTEPNLTPDRVNSLITIKKSLLRTVINGVQQLSVFDQLKSSFDKSLDESILIQPQISQKYPLSLIPGIFIYSNPNVTTGQQIEYEYTNGDLVISHKYLFGEEEIKIITHPKNFIREDMKQISALVFDETFQVSHDKLTIFPTYQVQDKTCALSVLVYQTEYNQLFYYPFVVELPNNYKEIVKPNGQMISDQELNSMLEKSKTVITTSRHIILPDDTFINMFEKPQIAPKKTNDDTIKPHVSREEAIRNEIAILLNQSYKNWNRINDLKDELRVIVKNKLRKHTGNKGGKTKDKIKMLNRGCGKK